MSKKLEIVCDGDSWVFGCEIVDPVIQATYPAGTYAGEFDYMEFNDTYRVPRIFPTYLSQLLNAEVTNLAYPADDNGTILNRTMVYLSKEYIAKKRSTENLLVIVGWSSPERNVFWYKDETGFYERFRLWPNVPHFSSKAQEDFWKLYVEYLWHPEEYMPRYVMNVLQLQNFCNAHNIKWMCFNAFYQAPGPVDIKDWQDLSIREELVRIQSGGGPYHVSTDEDAKRRIYTFDYADLWDTVDPIRFYKKDLPDNTFRSFIQKSDANPVLHGWHPSPESHLVWAKELIRYINENNLLK